MFKKKIISSGIFLTTILSFGKETVYALTLKEPNGVVKGPVEPTNVVTFILTILVALGVVASVAFLIHGGYKWTTSGGDKGAIEAARSQIIASIVGLIITICSFVIIRLVLKLLGAGDIWDFNIPSVV